MSGSFFTLIDGCGYEDDQVPRYLKFRARCPEWQFTFTGTWRAWRELPTGGEEHCRIRLDHLLDVLENIERDERPDTGAGTEGSKE